MIRFAGYVCAFALMVAACGGDDRNSPFPLTDAGPRADARIGPDAGDDPDGAPVDPEGPSITLLSPTEPAAGDYSSDAIVIAGQFVATCEVDRNATSNTPIDSSSVRLVASNSSRTVTATAIPTGAAGQYSASLDVSAFANGRLDVGCTASDLGDPIHTNSTTISTFLDLGPRIDLFSPVAGSSYGQQVDVSFIVTEQPVASDDDGADIDDVALSVGGVDFPVMATGGGSYFASVEFDDAAFVPELAGLVGISITASNSRSPTSVARTADLEFVADSDGPVISISVPDPGQVVGGFVEISASVTDTAGVATVVARIAHQYEVPLTRAGSTFSGTFDTRILPDTFVFPLIEIVALDAVGNEAGIGRIVTLDNRPPMVSLDPPTMREARCMLGFGCPPGVADSMECSKIFDPLGDDAVDDGETVGQLFELRARIEDQGNGPIALTSDVFIPHAGVDPGNVRIFLLDDQALPLLVDLDGDFICDDINPAIAPTSFPTAPDEAAVASLLALDATGGAFYAEDIDALGSQASMDDSACLPALDFDEDPPAPLCPLTTSATRIIAGLDSTSAIYSLAPVTDTVCMGNPFDAPATHIADGWACVAVRAEDQLGNMRISAPLRVCIDSDGDGNDDLGSPLSGVDCAGLGGIAPEVDRPSCTDGCVPASSFVDVPGYQLPIRF